MILFECGKRDEATLRVDHLIDIADDRPLYITVLVRKRQDYW